MKPCSTFAGAWTLWIRAGFEGDRPNRLLEHSNSHFGNGWPGEGWLLETGFPATPGLPRWQKNPGPFRSGCVESNYAIALRPGLRKTVPFHGFNSGLTILIAASPSGSAARERNLVEIETDGTESAERIAGQRAGERGICIVGFVGKVSYVDRNLHSFYPVRDGRIVNHV